MLTSTASAPKDLAMSGIAGVMIVASRISMKNAPATSSAIALGNSRGTSRSSVASAIPVNVAAPALHDAARGG